MIFGMQLQGLDGLEETFSEMAGLDSPTWWVGTNVEYAAEVHENHKSQSKYLARAVENVNQSVVAEDVHNLINPDNPLTEMDQVVRTLAFETERQAGVLTPVDTGNLMGSIAAGPTITQMRDESETRQFKDN